MLHDIAFGIIIGLIFISLVVFFCILVVKLYIQKIKTYTQTLYQKDLDYQKAINETIIETQEQVLNNISQDLHDDAGQQLTYINFQLENLKLDSPELQQLLEPLSESVGHLSHSIRGISHALNNQLLLQQDVFKAIETEVGRLRKNKKITIDFSHQGNSLKEFTANEKIIIYRIFQEIINNSFKHAKASVISIHLKYEPDFKMTVSDNGKGFDPESAKHNTLTLGLHNISRRAEIINYTVKIESKIGEGTTIILSGKNPTYYG